MLLTRERSTKVKTERLVIVSNRLPIALSKGESGNWQVKTGSGGLVSALAPILRERGGLWIGWPGTVEAVDLRTLPELDRSYLGYSLKPVNLNAEEKNLYYLGFSNEIIWPLFHDVQTRCNFNPAYWDMYQSVNRKFAQEIASNVSREDFIWIHDYHLMLVAKELRSLGIENKIGFFLHTPFPAPDIFSKLPWRLQVLKALLDYDLIGFQTARDRNNFIHCAETLIKSAHCDTRRQVCVVTTATREVGVGIFPISIDFSSFSRLAASAGVTEKVQRLKETMPKSQLMLGVDRLDYSKGIPEKLRAFQVALETYPQLRGKLTLMQLAVPSREDIPEYQRLRAEVNTLVSEINGKLAGTDWVPVRYLFRSVDRAELVSYYRAADIALITPLKDGMNLVAKEYCAAKIDGDGVLVLSEFAGSAAQLHKNAILVNPYDIEGVANAIYRAYQMSTEERHSRMRRLRNSIRKRNIFWWVDFFLWAANTPEAGTPWAVSPPSPLPTP